MHQKATTIRFQQYKLIKIKDSINTVFYLKEKELRLHKYSICSKITDIPEMLYSLNKKKCYN
jgi:hypothetical protein